MGSVCQRAAKFLTFKIGGLKEKSATRPQSHLNQSAWVQLWPGSNHSQSLTDGNFANLWPMDPKFTALKDLNLLKKNIKDSEAGSISKVCFALLKWPHFNRAYLVAECKHISVVVQWCQIENQQSPVYVMKWGHFDKVKSTFKMLLSS